MEADRGTPYDISQPEIEALKSFSQPSINGPYVSRKVVTEAVVEHNKPGRLPPPEETAAIEQTGEILTRGSVHLDVVINAFLDLDTVFPLAGDCATTSHPNGVLQKPVAPTYHEWRSRS